MITLILGALIGQAPFPAEAMDWAFMRAQEETVMAWTPKGNEAFMRAMPFDVARHILGMGNDKWRDRDYHKAALRAMGPRAAPWLYHALHLGDAEIRMRAENLLRELSQCPTCQGKGMEPCAWGERECTRCWTVGNFWSFTPFYDIAERNQEESRKRKADAIRDAQPGLEF